MALWNVRAHAEGKELKGESAMLLIRNADLYDPVPSGLCDIAAAGGLILSVRPAGESPFEHLAA